VEEVAQVLCGAGIIAEAHAEPAVPLWEKFVAHGGFGGMAALTRLPLGPLMACEETRAMVFDVMQEIVPVGYVRGVAIPSDCIDRIIVLVEGLPPMARPSLLEDLADGRRLELESINGAIVRAGRQVGVPTPLNAAIYAALKPYANGAPPFSECVRSGGN
jgi:2-dehydropantoate 2-reductase